MATFTSLHATCIARKSLKCATNVKSVKRRLCCASCSPKHGFQTPEGTIIKMASSLKVLKMITYTLLLRNPSYPFSENFYKDTGFHCS